MVSPSILDVSDDVTIVAAPRMSEDEFVAWALAREDNAEWVDGEVIPMSPAAVRHVEIVLWLGHLLDLYVLANGLGKVFGSELMVRLQHARVSRRVPDLMFVSTANLGRLQTNHLEGPPDLAIEVVSPESRNRDWGDKFAEYEAAGVLEYWIIDPKTETLQALFRNSDGKFIPVELDANGVLHSATVPGFWIRPTWLWQAELPNALDCLRELGVLG